MRFSTFNEYLFQEQVKEALESVERILEVNRKPKLAEEVEHAYGDKYQLADLLSNTTLIAQMNCLEQMAGLTIEKLQTIRNESPNQSITLRFQASHKCTFLREKTVSVPSSRQVETAEEEQSSDPTIETSTTKSTVTRIMQNIDEYHWKVNSQWETSLYAGTDVENRVILMKRSSSTVMVTQSKNCPLSTRNEPAARDVSLSYLLKHIDLDKKTASFRIDRENRLETKTPRRNAQVAELTTFLANLWTWCDSVRRYFFECIQRQIVDGHNPVTKEAKSDQYPDLGNLDCSSIFEPNQPLMEEKGMMMNVDEDVSHQVSGNRSSLTLPEKDNSSPLFCNADIQKMLNEQIRTIQEKIDSLKEQFPPGQIENVVSVKEAVFVILCEHCQKLGNRLTDSLDYIEKMLENQLVSAIGKRVRSSDVDQFVKYHNAKFLRLAPSAFCHAIRRPAHYPDGLISIESPDHDGKMEPIETHARQVHGPSQLKIPLDAATSIELTGKKYLHGWIQHRFENVQKEHKLVARARQFSSFILVVGTMMGSDQMEPKDAIILQNKDEVMIPLLSEALPTAKEFKDAIQSLSPEQQRFAKAFRSMQLESSVFGICVMQIKPQLESLLGLPEGSLTKEMKLTQDLMELFVEYQVPSDLVSFDGEDSGMDIRSKVENVKAHVEAVLEVIKENKMKQLEGQGMRADMSMGVAKELEPYPVGGGSVDSAASFSCRPGPGSLSLFSCPSPAEEAIFNRRSSSFALFGAAPAPAAPYPVGQSVSSVPSFSLGVSKGRDREARAGMRHRSMCVAPQQTACLNTNEPPTASRGGSLPSETTSVRSNALTTSTDKIRLAKTGNSELDSTASPVNNERVDFALIPKMLDSSIEKHDTDNALRSTVIKTSNHWSRMRQKNLLVKGEVAFLASSDIKSEKDKAFDLLDALSRSGSLAIACSELHVIISATHCFEKDVMGTVIQDNINPIEKLEMSTLVIASTIHGIPASSLVRDATDIGRLKEAFPALLGASND